MAPPIVLVVDTDWGFMVSLSSELHSRGIEPLPALTTGEARSMLEHLRREPDLLVIDCAIPGACTFASDMGQLRTDMPIIGIISEENDCNNCANLLSATFRDPEDKAFERIPYCAKVIEALMKEPRHNHYAGSH